jgi:MarR family 2-MHQ and catechol resistance regulon transcriptional repressor
VPQASVRSKARDVDVSRFYQALSRLLRDYQFRDRNRQMICGITVTQCYALEFLTHEGRLTVLELGRRLALNKSNASRVVDSLEAIGAVTRAGDPSNHRLRWIAPTARGRRLHREITTGLKRDYARILAPFDAAFVDRVTALLETLSARARGPAAPQPARTASGVTATAFRRARSAGRAVAPASGRR